MSFLSPVIGIQYSRKSHKYLNSYIFAAKKTEIASDKHHGSSLFSKIRRKDAGPVDKGAISNPQSFNHVAHMGFDSEKGFTTENIDPSWTKLLEQLNTLGISEDQIKGNEDFIRDFVAQAGGAEAMTSAAPEDSDAPAEPVPLPPSIPSASPPSRPPPPPIAAPSPKPAQTIKRKAPPGEPYANRTKGLPCLEALTMLCLAPPPTTAKRASTANAPSDVPREWAYAHIPYNTDCSRSAT